MGKSNNATPTKRKFIRSAMVIGGAEFLGTALLLFLGCMGGLPGLVTGPPTILQAALVFGITVATIVQIFGHVSGSHLNPVVTVSALILGAVDIRTALLYIVAQFFGATVGYSALVAITPQEAFYHHGEINGTHSFCVTLPQPNITSVQALLAEFIATSVLILLCCGIWDRRNQVKQDGVPLKFGLAIAAIAMAEGPYTGCSMNPARSFGPALVTNTWTSHWIYWLAPMLAGILMPYLYKYVFEERVEKPEEQQETEIPLNEQNKINSKSAEHLESV